MDVDTFLDHYFCVIYIFYDLSWHNDTYISHLSERTTWTGYFFSHLDKRDSCVITYVAVHIWHLIHLLLQPLHPGLDVLTLPLHLLRLHPHLLGQLCHQPLPLLHLFAPRLESLALLLLPPLQVGHRAIEGFQFGVDVSHLGFGLVHMLLQTLAQLQEAVSHHVHVVPGGMLVPARQSSPVCGETGCCMHQDGQQEDEELWHLHLENVFQFEDWIWCLSVSLLSAAEWQSEGFYSSVLQQRAALIGCQRLRGGDEERRGMWKVFHRGLPAQDLNHDAINALNYWLNSGCNKPCAQIWKRWD